MMEPVLLEGSSPNYRILHRCRECGFERVNKVQSEDSTDAILALARNPHPPLGRIYDPEKGTEVNPLAAEQAYPEAEKGEMESNIKRHRGEPQ